MERERESRLVRECEGTDPQRLGVGCANAAETQLNVCRGTTRTRGGGGGGGGDVELWEGAGDGRARSSLGLLLRDAVQGEAAADIVEQTEEPAEGAGRW